MASLGVGKQVDAARAAIGRATAIPFAVRLGVGLSGLIAMMVAWPIGLVASQYALPLLLLVALYPAVAPRGRGATFSALVVVAGWIARLKPDELAAEKCTSAKASCREGKQRCCDCSEEPAADVVPAAPEATP